MRGRHLLYKKISAFGGALSKVPHKSFGGTAEKQYDRRNFSAIYYVAFFLDCIGATLSRPEGPPLMLSVDAIGLTQRNGFAHT